MDDTLWLLVLKQVVHARTVSEVKANKAKSFATGQECEACLFEMDVIVSVKVVETDDGITPVEQSLGDVEADKPGNPRY
jgi:hypothetical protein